MSAELRKKIAINYGLILGGVGLVIGVLQYILIEDYNPAVSGSGSIALVILQMALLVALPFYALHQLRTAQGGAMLFKEGFKTAFTIIIYATLIGVVWLLLYTMVLEPEYLETAREAAVEEMVESNPNMTDAEMDMAVGMMEKFMSPWMMVIMSILGSAIMGLIIAAIGAAIFKRNPPVSSEL